MNDSNKIIENFIITISENHLNPPESNKGIQDLDFWNNFLATFPIYEFKDIAYRSLGCCKETLSEIELKKPGTSWSSTREGNKIFSDKNLSSDYIVIESLVKGVNLGSFLRWVLAKEWINIDSEHIYRCKNYVDEDEVVCLNLIGPYQIISEIGVPSEIYHPLNKEYIKNVHINRKISKAYKGIVGIKKNPRYILLVENRIEECLGFTSDFQGAFPEILEETNYNEFEALMCNDGLGYEYEDVLELQNRYQSKGQKTKIIKLSL